jgi:hypothetical protein
VNAATWIKVQAVSAWAQGRRRLGIRDPGLGWAGSGLEQALGDLAIGDPARAGTAPAAGHSPRGARRRLGRSGVVAPPDGDGDPKLDGMLRCLDEHGAFRYPHAVGNFEEHLIGTWRVLACWRQPPEITRCGLMHSAYATDAYPIPLIRPRARDAVRSLIGEGAEALVFLFCTLDRGRLLRDVQQRGAIPGDGLAVRNWITGEELHVGPAIVGAYLTVELANLAEQAQGRKGAPGTWMAVASRLASMLRGHVASMPPIFDGGTVVLSPEAEQRARTLYLEAAGPGGTDAGARRQRLLAIAEANPWIAEPHLDLAIEAAAAGRADDARAHASHARERLCQWGTSWDKRRPWGDGLETAERLAGG